MIKKFVIKCGITRKNNKYPEWESGIKEWPRTERGYYIYNYRECADNTYEGLFVIELNCPPNGKQANCWGMFDKSIVGFEEVSVGLR